MKNETIPDRLARLRRRYSALCEQLSTKALVLNGSLTPRSAPLWRWTRKLKTRTVSQYLPEAAAADFRRAVHVAHFRISDFPAISAGAS